MVCLYCGSTLCVEIYDAERRTTLDFPDGMSGVFHTLYRVTNAG